MGKTISLTSVKKSLSKKEGTDKKNASAVQKAVRKVKEAMYNYPADITELPDRKKFRAAARKKKAKFARLIAKEKDSAKKATLVNKANKWAKKTYSKGEIPTF